MRIAVTYSYLDKIGGLETYLDTVIRELVLRGHDVSYCYEVKSNSTGEQIGLPKGIKAWCVAELGAARALDELREWRPDIIYSHGFLDNTLEEAIINVAPAVILAHGFYGTCISGSKTFKRPSPKPCDRRFGAMCLLNYYARGCGGLSPVTMMTDYLRQAGRLKSLQKYKAVITASDFMRKEFIRNGVDKEKVHRVSLPIGPADQKREARDLRGNGADHNIDGLVGGNGSQSDAGRIWRLLFLGRMTRLKGGEMLLEALPRVRAALGTRLRVTFAGDGPERRNWQRKAEQIQARFEGLEVEFPGWLSGENLEATLRNSDLLAVPSVWPEPFGLVGLEAGLRSVPVAAFDVGGISDWLIDGLNGHLAPGNPPTAGGLAQAIVACLKDRETQAQLGTGASEIAQQFNINKHLTGLLEVFNGVLSAR